MCAERTSAILVSTHVTARSRSHALTRPHARACTHAQRQSCARAHACACTHKHTSTRTVTRCPHNVAHAVACAYGGVRDSVQMWRCSRRQRCRQILRARWPRRALLCAQARQRSCESRRPVSSATAVAHGTQPVGAECRSTSRRSMDSDPAACTMHRYQHAVVSCMEEVACHSVARSMLHATCRMVYAACCMHHAACCMRDASGAQGEWLDLVCGGNQPHRVFSCGFSSTTAVCRTCRTLTPWSCRTCK